MTDMLTNLAINCVCVSYATNCSCYNYGASPEVGITSADGSTNVIKWRTLGRISHETA
jgi:hypothetical protein